jgi:ribonuclease VapC
VIVDTSSLIAILRGEAEALAFAKRIEVAQSKVIAAPTYVETCMVFASRKGADKKFHVDELLRQSEIEIVPFTPQAAAIAVEAFLKYGKGRGHKAQLNFGDCVSYAMSKLEVMPLLFKGEDFRHTDVVPAL